ncbi:hypothetical protein [Streptomyces cyaneus]|uniref:hypothetical protein n=1 Tax=Streptomyces cyaneus TaxID=1904 RepID=UPI000FF8B395|nr:hypothetical protein [Streptomyces cyaneus]
MAPAVLTLTVGAEGPWAWRSWRSARLQPRAKKTMGLSALLLSAAASGGATSSRYFSRTRPRPSAQVQ